MKKLSILTVSVIFSTFLYAQDTIVKINGDKIFAKILEITTTEIKYKKFDFQDGPSYIESKSNVQLIKYANGSKEVIEQQINNTIKPAENTTDYYSGPLKPNNKIIAYGTGFWYKGNWMREPEMQKILLSSNDQQIALLMGNAKKAKRSQRIGYVAIPLVIMTQLFTAIGSNTKGQGGPIWTGAGAICLVGAISLPIASGVFKHKRNIANSEAIKLYNAKF